MCWFSNFRGLCSMFRSFRCLLGATLALGAPFMASGQTAGAAPASSGSAFNPKISLILDGKFAHYRSDAAADVPGVLLGEETGFAPSGLSIGETELALEANVDQTFHAWTTIAVSEEGEI